MYNGRERLREPDELVAIATKNLLSLAKKSQSDGKTRITARRNPLAVQLESFPYPRVPQAYIPSRIAIYATGKVFLEGLFAQISPSQNYDCRWVSGGRELEPDQIYQRLELLRQHSKAGEIMVTKIAGLQI